MEARREAAVPDHWSGGIDDLVEQANARLSTVLPDDRAARPKDEVNARLVRHYTTQGLLPAPWREGREARYGPLHLLKLLALRRLMADGLSGKALYAALDGKDSHQLVAIVTLGTEALEGLAMSQTASSASASTATVENARAAPPGEGSALHYLQALKREARPSAAGGALPASSMLRKRAQAESAEEALPPAPAQAAPAPAAAPAKADAALPDFLLPKKFRQQRTLRNVEVQPGLEIQVASDFDWPEDQPAWDELIKELRLVLHDIEREE